MVAVLLQYTPIIHKLNFPGYDISVLRLDLIHPEISGNKWFKLKYNLQEAKLKGKNTVITFGGAFSNHITATAYACKEAGLKCIGFIRGEASSIHNATLSFAEENGMKLNFVSREEYGKKHFPEYLNALQQSYSSAYIIPEGGDNGLGQKGCEEILSDATKHYTHLFCAYGTGTTAKGMSKSLSNHQTLTAVNVLKYEAGSELANIEILNHYHFGGYAKHTPQLVEFKNWFEETFNIELDYVYTSKAFYAVFDLIKKNKLNAADKILMIHTGGLQGNKGYETRYNLNPKRHVNDAQG